MGISFLLPACEGGGIISVKIELFGDSVSGLRVGTHVCMYDVILIKPLNVFAA